MGHQGEVHKNILYTDTRAHTSSLFDPELGWTVGEKKMVGCGQSFLRDTGGAEKKNNDLGNREHTQIHTRYLQGATRQCVTRPGLGRQGNEVVEEREGRREATERAKRQVAEGARQREDEGGRTGCGC